MTEKELRKRCKDALAEMKRKAGECSLCNSGQGRKDGLEDAAWLLECALDKRHKRDI